MARLPRGPIVVALAAAVAAGACGAAPAGRGGNGSAAAPETAPAVQASDTTAAFFDTLLARAAQERWERLPIGERLARFALALEGRPYLDATLEGPGDEVCRITSSGFDCVTLMETCLALARITASPAAGAPSDFGDLARAVTFTRYRDGRIDGYTSRLHYTSDWILENARRGVLRDVTAEFGGTALPPGVGYMSAHPERYAALAGHPERVDAMRAIERRLNADSVHVLPVEDVAAIEGKLMSGDLVAIATSIEGLDYSHTGLIYRDETGAARFLHASSKQRRVVLDAPLHEYLAGGPKSQAGITVLRPVEDGGTR